MLANTVQANPLCLMLKEIGKNQLDITSDPRFLTPESNKENANPSTVPLPTPPPNPGFKTVAQECWQRLRANGRHIP